MQASSLQPIENLDTQFFELSALTTMVLRWAKFSRLWRILRVTCCLDAKMPSWCSMVIIGETIPMPGTGYIRSFAADSRGVVWFSSSTQIGYLSRVDGEYRVVKVYED